MQGTYGHASVGDEIGERVTNGEDRETDDRIREPKDEPKGLKRRRVSTNRIEEASKSVTWRTFTTSSAISMIHTTETINPMEHLAN